VLTDGVEFTLSTSLVERYLLGTMPELQFNIKQMAKKSNDNKEELVCNVMKEYSKQLKLDHKTRKLFLTSKQGQHRVWK